LSFSAASAIILSGLFIVVPWEKLCDAAYPSLVGTTLDPKLKILMGFCPSWDGPWARSILTGPEATKQYCKITTFTFLPVVAVFWGATSDFFLQLALWLGYVYFGYVD